VDRAPVELGAMQLYLDVRPLVPIWAWQKITYVAAGKGSLGMMGHAEHEACPLARLEASFLGDVIAY
jgi:hypothetical protein